MTSDHDPVDVLKRWEDFGGTWQVISHTGPSVVVSMCRCDGGEEVQRLSSADPALLTWLDGRTSNP
jgi:hypothetical protein